jgi:putative transposase
LVRPRKNYTKTTNSKHWLKRHPNLPRDRKAERPEEAFVSDITYIKSRERTHYLSLVTEAFSRKIMGYHLRRPERGKCGRSAEDDGQESEDRSAADPSFGTRAAIRFGGLSKRTAKARHTPSMTDGHDCYQNAPAERANGILKQEFLTEKCNTGAELELLVKQSSILITENVCI